MFRKRIRMMNIKFTKAQDVITHTFAAATSARSLLSSISFSSNFLSAATLAMVSSKSCFMCTRRSRALCQQRYIVDGFAIQAVTQVPLPKPPRSNIKAYIAFSLSALLISFSTWLFWALKVKISLLICSSVFLNSWLDLCSSFAVFLDTEHEHLRNKIKRTRRTFENPLPLVCNFRCKFRPFGCSFVCRVNVNPKIPKEVQSVCSSNEIAHARTSAFAPQSKITHSHPRLFRVFPIAYA